MGNDRAGEEQEKYKTTAATQHHQPFPAIPGEPLLNKSVIGLPSRSLQEEPAALFPRIPQGHLPAPTFPHGTSPCTHLPTRDNTHCPGASGAKADRGEDARGTGGNA